MQEHIEWQGDALLLLDQRVLPRRVEHVRVTDADTAFHAIRDMVIRGAPAIGITAAYGLALEAQRGGDLDAAAEHLLQARPTAVNLRWAVERMREVPVERWTDEALAIHAEDIANNRAMGEHGAPLLPANARCYSHCNAGALATGGWGTSLGILRTAHQQGKIRNVWVGETRPYLQGARLTAWELERDGVPCTLVCDSVAASLMAAGEVDAVVVGADRVAANGDVANKIGTLGLAVLARHYGVDVIIAVPTATLDLDCPTGADIPIEQRAASEVKGHAGVEWAADVPVFNPGFDVTPAELVTAWVTEHGLWTPGD